MQRNKDGHNRGQQKQPAFSLPFFIFLCCAMQCLSPTPLTSIRAPRPTPSQPIPTLNANSQLPQQSKVVGLKIFIGLNCFLNMMFPLAEISAIRTKSAGLALSSRGQSPPQAAGLAGDPFRLPTASPLQSKIMEYFRLEKTCKIIDSNL